MKIYGRHLHRLATAMAINQLDLRYRRTAFGRSWIAITFLLFVSVKIIIFAGLNGLDWTFFAPYLAVGYFIFRFISQAVTAGAGVFISATSWLKTEPLPSYLYLAALLNRNTIMAAYMAIPTVMICAVSGHYTLTALISFPFVCLLFAINHIWVSAVVGVVAARYRDVVQILTTLMQVLYFVTPILWVPDGDGIRSLVAFYNPLSHYIAVFRDPLLFDTIPWVSWAITLAITICGCVLGYFVYQKNKDKLVYWI